MAGNAAVSMRQLELGDFRSVGVEDCVERLSRIAKLCLTGRQQRVLRSVNALRNRVAHYIEPTDLAEVKAVVGSGLNVFVEFVNSEFEGEDPYEAKTMPQLVEELRGCDEFVKERLAGLKECLCSAARPRTRHVDECARCLQDAAVIEGDEIHCLFCGDRYSIEKFAQGRSENGLAEPCPECGRLAVIVHGAWENRTLPTLECFCCGYFRGPELKWADWTLGKSVPIPRLHDDRYDR